MVRSDTWQNLTSPCLGQGLLRRRRVFLLHSQQQHTLENTLSDVRSTGRHREPRGQDIASGVYVAIVLCLAGWARPATNIEWKLIENVSATGAHLAARMEPIDLHESAPVPRALVRKLPKQLVPSRIGNHTSQPTVAKHVGDTEVFDGDHLVFANESNECRRVRATLEEVGVGRLEMSEGLLERRARHLSEKGEGFLLLPFSERSAHCKIADRLLVERPGTFAFGESLVVDEARASDGAAEQGFLIRSRVDAEAEASREHFNNSSSPVRQCIIGDTIAMMLGGKLSEELP